MTYKETRKSKDGKKTFGLRDDGQWEEVKSDADPARPYPNEHSCRLREPGDFEKDSFKRMKRKHDGKEYSVVMGRLKGKKTLTDQSFRYPRKTWKETEAKTHCKGHEGNFEPAKGEKDWLAGDELTPALFAVKQAGATLCNRDGLPMPYLEGSWEQMEAELEEDAREWLAGAGVKTDGMEAFLIGTYDGWAVVALRSWWSMTPAMNCYRGNWKMVDQEPQWDGTPEPVELVLTVEPPEAEDVTEGEMGTEASARIVWKTLATRKGKLSRKHEASLTQAVELMDGVKGAGELKAATRASAEKAHTLVDGVLQKIRGAANESPAKAGAESAGRKLLAALAAGVDDIDPFLAEGLVEALGPLAQKAAGRRETRVLEQLLGAV